MELEKLGRQLKLMLLLTQNVRYSVDDISQKLGMSRRTVYRYIDAFKALGFVVEKSGTKYRLDHSSPFFHELTSEIRFTEDEALTIAQVLNSVYDNSTQIRSLRQKLTRIYTPDILAKHGVSTRFAHNLSTLFQCIREERVCLIRGYDSPSSGKVSDRIVEPYLFLNGNNEVRCYELASKMNKTFKLGRMESVEPLDLLWTNKDEHKPFYTDLFHFSGEERTLVTLLLGKLSTSLLLEEFPSAEEHLTQLPDGRHRLSTEVCSMKGVGRFVMGLADDIEVVHSPALSAYLHECAERAAERFR